MHYLITGGSGFIGSHLVHTLLERGDQVTVLDNFSTGRRSNLDDCADHSALAVVPGSVLDPLLMDELVEGVDCVVHLAAAVGVRLIVEQPLKSLLTNIRGTENVFEAAHRYRRKVFVASTSEIYGKNSQAGLTETSDRLLGAPSMNRWSYSTSKAVDEYLAFAYWAEKQIPTVIGRFFNTVGPRQTAEYGMVIPNLVRRALDGAPLLVHGDGQQSRCFGHVADTVSAVVSLLEHPDAVGQAYNIGSHEEVTILELARRIVDRTGGGSEVRLIPYEQVYGPGFEDMRRRVPDTTKLRELTGWKAKHNLDAIIDDVVRHELLVRQQAEGAS